MFFFDGTANDHASLRRSASVGWISDQSAASRIKAFASLSSCLNITSNPVP